MNENNGNKLADIEHQIEEIYDYQIDLGYVEQKPIDLEDRSRRNNLRVDGIRETPGETWEWCEEKLQQVFQEKLGLGYTPLKSNEHIKRQTDKILRAMVTTHEQ